MTAHTGGKRRGKGRDPMRDAEKTIGNLIDKQTTAYLGSLDREGFPNVKAFLAPRKREGIRVFYFTTNTSSRHTAQFRADSRACLYFCDKRFFRGVMLRGAVEVLEDASSRAMIWQEGDTRYYPLGVNDPDYLLPRVEIHGTGRKILQQL